MTFTLSDEQKAIVKHGDEPLLVIAGPGTGKTRCLAHRAAYLIIEKGINPKKILAITFTNTAAEEMLDRLEKIGLVEMPYVTTLHSFAKSLLHINSSKLGINPNFLIPDPKYEIFLIIEDVAKDLCLQISTANIISTSIHAKMARGKLNSLNSPEQKFYNRFSQLLKFYKAVDFNNIIFLAYLLLTENSDVKEYYNNSLAYILVDEYQDLNPTEQWLIDALTKNGRGLAVFGDDDQSIFGWRWADPIGIVHFDKKFSSIVILELTESWRCPEVILEAAKQVIRHNKNRRNKFLKAKKEGGQLILYEAGGPRDEAIWVAEEVKKLTGKKKEEIVILCLNKDLIVPIEQELKKRNLNFVISFRKKYLLASPSVRKLLVLLRIRKDPSDNLAVRQLLELAYGVGDKCIKSLRDKAERDNISLFESMELAISNKKWVRWRKALVRIMEEISEIEKLDISGTPQVFIEGLKLYIEEERDVNELLDKIDFRKITTIEEFSGEIEKLIFDQLRESKISVSSDRITVMTMHSAKGLEADIVFLPGLEHGVFPRSRDIEEERRLFYVALTRARKTVYLSYAKMRKDSVSRGYRPYSEGRPSRFISEIPNKLLTTVN